jgi:lipopolysaccharide assembly protein A
MSSDAADVRPAGRRRFALRHWVAVVLVLLAAIFMAQNRDRHPIQLLWITVGSPTWFVLTVVFATGLLVGLLLRRRRRR